jgi:hypothetical protein
MLQKIFVAATAMLFSMFSYSQDNTVAVNTAGTPSSAANGTTTNTTTEEKKPFLTITGSADAYYRYDFAKTRMNNFTSFTNSHGDFNLGMASVKFEHKSEKVGFVADLGFGNRAKEFAYFDDGVAAAIKQLYVSYSPADWLKFTAGSWATHVGYELLDPQLNRNYSMSYMFTNGPFSHTGVKADVTKGKHAFMIGVSNPTDMRTVPDGYIHKKFLIAQYSLTASEKVKLFLNYVGGKAIDTTRSNQVDLVVTGKISDKFNIGFNGTVAGVQAWDGVKNLESKSWWGSALYLNLDPGSVFGLTLRGEYFSDKNQLKTFASATAGGNVFATTLSANFRVAQFIFIPEVRVDKASEEIFVDKNGSSTKSAASILFAAVYSF